MHINWLFGFILNLFLAAITSMVATVMFAQSFHLGHVPSLWAGLFNAVVTIGFLAVTFNIGDHFTNDMFVSYR